MQKRSKIGSKREHHYKILQIEISLSMTLLNFWIKLTQKEYFQTKKKENYHRILHIQINLDSNFQLQHF